MVDDYLKADCYKFISCDPSDTVIRDLASFKTGVAQNFADQFEILEHTELIEFVESFKKIIDIIMSHRKNFSSDFNFQTGEFSESGSGRKRDYTLLDVSSVEEDQVTMTLLQIFQIFEQIDAGGMDLVQLYNSKHPYPHFKAWLYNLWVWGSYFPLDPTANYDPETTQAKGREKLYTLRTELRQVIQDNEFLTSNVIILVISFLVKVEKLVLKIEHWFQNN